MKTESTQSPRPDALEARTLAGRTILMSGGSRGIGLAIAERAARDGANIAIIAKTAEPHPRLEGTIHTAAEAIERAGGRALPILGDVRDEASIREAVERTASEFGGIDIVVNNASAIDLSPTTSVSAKKLDLMHDVNTRGTFLLSQAALPWLAKSADPRVLTLSPPLNLEPRWLGAFPAYMLSKYGMTLATLGLAAEFAGGIGERETGERETGERGAPLRAACLWPRTMIRTAAVRNVIGDEFSARSRTPELYADAAHLVLTDPEMPSGATLLCEDVLLEAGVTDLERYAPGVPESELAPDAFV
ncbi:General stress protein 39 [Pseudoclavibacter triregionum]|nr:General stress protein 39 [Pseudoclavibacter triregionum]